MKPVVFCFLALVCVGNLHAQARIYLPQTPTHTPSFPDAVGVSIEPLDSACVAFGITGKDVEDVLRLSVEGAGWECRPSADLFLSVKLTPLAQRQEDLFTFQIDVAAGAQVHPLQEGEGGLSGSAIVDVPQGGNAKLLSQVQLLVSRVARRLRQEVMKKTYQQGPSREDLRLPSGELILRN